MEKILLALLGAKGDCVYGTTLAHQIKADNPECHLVWAISSDCRDILRNNPHVDEVWEIPADSHHGASSQWKPLMEEAHTLAGRGILNRVYPAQISPGNYQNYDGTVRPSIMRAYGRPITVPMESHVVLTEEEIRKVEDFVARHDIIHFPHRVLVECIGKSKQTHVTPDHALRVAHLVLEKLPDACFIISTHQRLESDRANMVQANALSYRENLALAKYCTQLVGCGSGISALINTCAGAPVLPTIQLLAADTSVYASPSHDFVYWGLDANHFVEMWDSSPEETAQAVIALCTTGLSATRKIFHRDPQIHFRMYTKSVTDKLLACGRIIDAAYSLSHVVTRYGWNNELLVLGEYIVSNIPQEKLLLRQAHAVFIRDFCRSFTKALRNTA